MTMLAQRRSDPSPQKSSSADPFPIPSPARPSLVNPFARPKIQHEPSSFTRTALLPSLSSPVKAREQHALTTPAEKLVGASTTKSTTSKAREGWRMLWRGGLELGNQGWRLDGITFYALLSFPATPSASSQPTPNPFDPATGSPFATLPDSGTDLCLSLESMRGRKYLQVRGLIDLPEAEVLDGAETGDGAVQMAIAPTASLLAAYFIGLLCREPKLNKQGRTLSAIVIGLGDEDIEDSSNPSTILVYGQQALGNPTSLRLCVGRRKPTPQPPTERKVRPGEPLPRAPLFFPVKGPKKPPPPFRARPLSRAPSVNSIYRPPPQLKVPLPTAKDGASKLPVAPVTGRTPGRRGEKRPRKEGEDDERKRKAGRIMLPQPAASEQGSPAAIEPPEHSSIVKQEPADDDDIFGKRTNSIAPVAVRSEDTPNELSSTTRKRPRVPTQVLDNKAAIRKQTLVLLNGRGYAREHELFKDVFGMTTKGTNFALREELEIGPVHKEKMHRIIGAHLDLYLPAAALLLHEPPDFPSASDDGYKGAEVKAENTAGPSGRDSLSNNDIISDDPKLRNDGNVFAVVKEEEGELEFIKEEQAEIAEI